LSSIRTNDSNFAVSDFFERFDAHRPILSFCVGDAVYVAPSRSIPGT
jgi:hypothetical protein